MAISTHLTRVNPFVIYQHEVPLIASKQKLNKRLNFKIKTIKAKTGDAGDQTSKTNSVICGDCDGNGAVLCSQCKGSGVNAIDFFNGEFKTGESCWLCGGKKDMLCGNCNGAGFVGGFMTSFDN